MMRVKDYSVSMIRRFIPVVVMILFLSGCVYTIKPAQPIALDSRLRDNLVASSEVRVIHFTPRPEIWLKFTSRSEWLPVEDPLILVKEKFIDSLKTRKFIQNVHPISQARLNNDLQQLKRTFRRGLTLSFHTTSWALEPYWDGKNLYHHLSYSVIARLIRVESEEILWLNECHVTEIDTLGKKYTYADYQKDNYALLRVMRNTAFRKCADDLFSNFVGN